jgi:hypothetical protein
MFLSAVSVLVVVQLSSEVPEGHMNYPVFDFHMSVLCKYIFKVQTTRVDEMEHLVRNSRLLV